jgi:hypothetical protein
MQDKAARWEVFAIFNPHQILQGYQIMKHKMGRTQGRKLEEQTCIKGFSRKT